MNKMFLNYIELDKTLGNIVIYGIGTGAVIILFGIPIFLFSLATSRPLTFFVLIALFYTPVSLINSCNKKKIVPHKEISYQELFKSIN